MKTISSTTPILVILGLALLLSMSLYAALLLQRIPPPEGLFGVITAIVGALVAFLQHKPQDGGGGTAP